MKIMFFIQQKPQNYENFQVLYLIQKRSKLFESCTFQACENFKTFEPFLHKNK